MIPNILVLQHVVHEGMGTLGILLRTRNVRTTIFNLIDHPQISPNPNFYDGLVILGGPMSVNDASTLPVLTKEMRLIDTFFRQDKPILGICLGAQLIAKTLGSSVKKNPVKEIGWYPLDLTSAGHNDPLFSAFNSHEEVFQWHGETFDLPCGSTLLASSPLCTHQAFRYRRAIGLQFHLEVTSGMIREWVNEENNAKEIKSLKGAIDPQIIINRSSYFSGRLKQIGDSFFSAYLGMLSLK